MSKVANKLAVLGGADGSLPTLQAARRLGIATVCLDMRGDAPGALVADEFCNVSTTDLPAVVAALRAIDGLTGVLSPASDVNLPAQFTAATALGLPSGLSEQAVRASVDKGYFRDVCDQLGCPSLGYVQGSAEYVVDGIDRLGETVMIKPADSSGSRGVAAVPNPARRPEREQHVAALEAAVAEALRYSLSNVVIAEEFVAGIPLTAEALIDDRQVVAIGISERELTPDPHFVTVAHLMSAPDALSDRIGALLEQICAALDYSWGAIDLDVILTPDGTLVPIELGARLGGNGLGELMTLSTGVDTTELAVAMATGERPSVRPRPAGAAAMRVLQAPGEGKLVRIDGVREALRAPEVVDVMLAVRPGEQVYPYTRAGAKLGYVLSKADDAADARRACSRAADAIRFTVEPLTAQAVSAVGGTATERPGGAWR